MKCYPAAELAAKIEKLLENVDPTVANRAIEFVWFYRIGRLFDWSRSHLRRADAIPKRHRRAGDRRL